MGRGVRALMTARSGLGGSGLSQPPFDAFNLGNLQRVLDYNNLTESAFGVPNPDYGAIGGPVTGAGYQLPQQVRIGVRFEF